MVPSQLTKRDSVAPKGMSEVCWIRAANGDVYTGIVSNHIFSDGVLTVRFSHIAQVQQYEKDELGLMHGWQVLNYHTEYELSYGNCVIAGNDEHKITLRSFSDGTPENATFDTIEIWKIQKSVAESIAIIWTHGK